MEIKYNRTKVNPSSSNYSTSFVNSGVLFTVNRVVYKGDPEKMEPGHAELTMLAMVRNYVSLHFVLLRPIPEWIPKFVGFPSDFDANCMSLLYAELGPAEFTELFCYFTQLSYSKGHLKGYEDAKKEIRRKLGL